MPDPSALDMLREGIALANAGKKEQARELIRQALQLDPAMENGWLWLAGIGESPLESLRSIEKVLLINPQNQKARAGLNPTRLRAGIAAAQANQRETALELFRECVRSDPKNESGWNWLASTTENPTEAYTALNKVLEINPTNEMALARLAPLREKLAQSRPVWQCPFCGHGSEARQLTCPECRAIFSLRRVEALMDNLDRDEEKLSAGLARLLDRVQRKPDFLLHYYLGLGLLQVQNLDLAITHFQQALKFPAEPRDVHDALRSMLTTLEKQQHLIRNRSTLHLNERPKTILIIDDSLTIRKVVSFTLRECGYRVLEASGGTEAFELIEKEGTPDLILLDIIMPEMDGYAVCKSLRSRKATANLPIVMLSGKERSFSQMRARLSGSTDYLTKPFQPETLLEKIHEFCS